MRIQGTFRDVAGKLSAGEVTLSSVLARPTAHGKQVVTRELHRIGLRDGGFLSPELEPGPVIVELHASGVYERWEVLVPSEENSDGEYIYDVADLVGDHVEWDAPVVAQSQQAARESARFADQAKEHAQHADDAAGRASRVIAEGAAEVRAEFAVWSKQAEEAAARAASASQTVSESMEWLKAEALPQIENVQEAAAQVSGVAQSAADAQRYAEEAHSHAQQAQHIHDSTSWDGDRLSVLGKAGPPLTGPQGPKGNDGETGPPGPPIPDTEWQRLELASSGWTAGDVRVRRIGAIVYLRVWNLMPAAPSTSARFIGEVPMGYRPPTRTVGVVTQQNRVLNRAYVWSSGASQERLNLSDAPDKGVGWSGEFSWTTNDAFPMSVTAGTLVVTKDYVDLGDAEVRAFVESTVEAAQTAGEHRVDAALAGKADVSHTHRWADLIGPVAAGDGARADGNAVAVGAGAQATHQGAVAIGAGATTSADNEIALGTAAHHVKVQGTLSVPVPKEETHAMSLGAVREILVAAGTLVEKELGLRDSRLAALESRIQLVDALPSAPQAGIIYLVKE